MHLSYSITEIDFASAQAFTQRRMRVKAASSARNASYLAPLWTAFALFMLTSFQATRASIFFLPGTLSTPLLWAGLTALIYFLWQTARSQSFLTAVRESAGPFPMAQELSVSEEGLKLSSPFAEYFFSWATVVAVEESQAAVLIAIRNGICFPVPSSAFESTETMHEFVAFATSRAGA